MSRLTLTERTNLLNSMTPEEREAFRRGEFTMEQFAELRLGMSEQDFAEGKARAERASTPAPAPDPLEAPTSFAGEVGQSFYGGLQNTLANRIQTAQDEEATGLVGAGYELAQKLNVPAIVANALTDGALREEVRGTVEQANPLLGQLSQAVGPNEQWTRELGAEGRERVRLAREATEQQRNQWFQGDGRLAQGEQLLRQIGQDVVDPSVAVSMIPIPFVNSSLAGIMAYDNAYVRYIEEGNSDEVASQLAAQEAGIEMGTAAIPMGKLLQRVPGLRSLFPNAAQRIAGDVASRGLAASGRRVAGSALQEGSQEFLAGVGQEEVLRQTDLDLSQQTEERRANLPDRLSVENVQDKLYQGLVGIVAGGGIRGAGELSGVGARMEAAENATEAFRQTVLNQQASTAEVAARAAAEADAMRARAMRQAKFGVQEVGTQRDLFGIESPTAPVASPEATEAAAEVDPNQMALPLPKPRIRLTPEQAQVQAVDAAAQAELAGLDAAVKKKQEKTLQKETAKRNATVRKSLAEWVAANPETNFANPTERLAAMKQAKAEIEAANPLPTAQPATPVTTAPDTIVAPEVETEGRAPASKTEVQEILDAQIPLESADKNTVSTKNQKRPSTLSVLQKLYKEDTVESRALARQIITGDVEVVDSAADIPSNAKVSEGATGVFFEDIKGNKRTFLIAPNALGKKKLGSAGLHEYTHDKQTAQARDDLSQTIVNGIGASNAKELLANIEKSANSGNKIAQNVRNRLAIARRAYEQSGMSKERVDAAMDREVVTYLLEENSASKGSSGSFGSIIRNLKRMVETTPDNFNDMTFDQMTEVMQGQMKKETLNRLSEVSKDRTKAAAPLARTEKQDTAAGLESVIGVNAKNWDTLVKDQGILTYYDPVDKKLKAVVSNYNHKLRLKPAMGQVYRLSEILDAPELFAAYPSLKDVVVDMDPTETGGTYFQRRGNMDERIVVGRDKLTRTEILSTILHEIQHGIQFREGFSQGGAPVNYDKLVAKATESRDKFIEAFNKVNESLNVTLTEMLPQLAQDTEFVKAADAITEGTGQALRKGTLSPTGKTMVAAALVKVAGKDSPYANLMPTLNAMLRDQAAADKSYEDYIKLAGEAEARQVQDDMNMTQNEINESGNPMNRYTNPMTKRNLPINELISRRSIARGEKSTDPLFSIDAITDGPSRAGVWANENRAARLLLRAFASAGGFYDTLVEKLENVKGTRAELTAKAEGFARDLDRAIAKEAAIVGTDQYDLAKQIEEQLEVINKLPADQRNPAFDKWADERGDVGKYVRELNKLQRSLSLGLLRQRQEALKRGVELTKDEARAFKAMLANLDTYTTRAYAAFMGDAGKKFADRTIKALEADLAREAGKPVNKRRTLTEAVRGKDTKLAKNARVALDFLLANNILIPPADQLSKLSTDKLTTLYRTWFNHQEGVPVTRQDMIARLQTVTPTPEQAQDKALLALKDLLGLGDKGSAIATYYRGAKLDRGILQAREHIPKELRDVMGEITDPSARYLLTISRQADLMAKTKMLLEIAEQGEGNMWAATRGDRFVNELRGKDFGPMEGRFVDQATFDALKGVMEITQQLEESFTAAATSGGMQTLGAVAKAAGTGWVRAVGYSKLSAVVLDPSNFAYNGVGSVIMAANNGVFRPQDIKDGLQGAFGVMRAASGLGNTDKGLEILRSYTSDSAAIGEIRSQEFRLIAKKLEEMTQADRGKLMEYLGKGFGGMVRAVSAGLITIKEAYALMDVWVKAASYYSNKRLYTSINEAGNHGWTTEQIERKAAYLANQTNVSYSRAIPAAKLLEKTGFIGQFLTFFSEVFRATGANAFVVLNMINEARRAGVTSAEGKLYLAEATRRSIGMVAATFFSVFVLEALSAFGDDDEEKEKVRALVENFSQDQALRYVGVDANGQYVFENMSRLDPIGPLTDILRAINNAEDGEAMEDGIEALGSLLFESSLFRKVKQSATAAGDARATVRLEENSKLAQIMPNAYAGGANLMGDTWVLTANVADAFLPGWSDALLSETNPPVVGPGREGSVFGQASDFDRISANALLAAGTRLVRTNPDRAANTAARDFTSIATEYRTRMTNVIRNRNASPEEAFAMVVEGMEEEQAALARLQRVYEGLEVVQGRRGAMTTLRNNRVPADVIGHLMNNRRYFTQIVTPSDLITLERDMLREHIGDREKQAEVRQYMRTLRNLYRGAN